MPAKIDGGEILKKNKIQEARNGDFSFAGLVDIESEIKWIKLHQMFDK
tara:strand:- start:110 stop:253 length:144 start_codon:yes stop_codon:yes gene_type:complete